MTTGKTIALTRRTFVGKVMSLLFNMLSRLAVTQMLYFSLVSDCGKMVSFSHPVTSVPPFPFWYPHPVCQIPPDPSCCRENLTE